MLRHAAKVTANRQGVTPKIKAYEKLSFSAISIRKMTKPMKRDKKSTRKIAPLVYLFS